MFRRLIASGDDLSFLTGTWWLDIALAAAVLLVALFIVFRLRDSLLDSTWGRGTSWTAFFFGLLLLAPGVYLLAVFGSSLGSALFAMVNGEPAPSSRLQTWQIMGLASLGLVLALIGFWMVKGALGSLRTLQEVEQRTATCKVCSGQISGSLGNRCGLCGGTVHDDCLSTEMFRDRRTCKDCMPENFTGPTY